MKIPETENVVMDVHHHTNHVKHKKKWKEYFFEFFMLFLAVMAGFIMENEREHFVEHRRAKQYAQSLYNDIKEDTATLRDVMNFSYEKLARLDTAISLLHNYPDHWNDTTFYMNITQLLRVKSFERSGATFEQVKSSGSLRYFDQDLVNLFNKYDVDAKRIREREDLENDVAINLMIPYFADIINTEAAYDIFSNQPITHELYLKKTDQDTIDKMINLSALAKRGRDRALFVYSALMKDAEETLKALEEDFHLK